MNPDLEITLDELIERSEAKFAELYKMAGFGAGVPSMDDLLDVLQIVAQLAVAIKEDMCSKTS